MRHLPALAASRPQLPRPRIDDDLRFRPNLLDNGFPHLVVPGQYDVLRDHPASGIRAVGPGSERSLGGCEGGQGQEQSNFRGQRRPLSEDRFGLSIRASLRDFELSRMLTCFPRKPRPVSRWRLRRLKKSSSAASDVPCKRTIPGFSFDEGQRSRRTQIAIGGSSAHHTAAIG